MQADSQIHLLDNFTIRPARVDDLEPVLRVMTAQNLADYGEPMVSAEFLRSAWQALGDKLEQHAWVVLSPQDEVCGYGELASNPERTKFQIAIYFSEAQRGRGIGSYLLRLAEIRASALAGGANSELFCRLSGRNTAALKIVEKAGYQCDLAFQIMEILMDAPPTPPEWAEGITVRTFIPGQDEQAVYQADEEASEDKGYHRPMTFAEWAKRMGLGGEGFDAGLWFLACSGVEIAGVALNFYSAATQTGWVDHLGVRRFWRRKGIGEALLRHALVEFHRRGVRRVRLSVDTHSLTNAPRLYARAGMRTVQQYHFYSKQIGELEENGPGRKPI